MGSQKLRESLGSLNVAFFLKSRDLAGGAGKKPELTPDPHLCCLLQLVPFIAPWISPDQERLRLPVLQSAQGDERFRAGETCPGASLRL